jgi:hypothetical protein
MLLMYHATVNHFPFPIKQHTYKPTDFISLKLDLCLLECDAMWSGKDLSALREEPAASNFYPEDREKHVPPQLSKFLPEYTASHPRR